MSSLRLTVDHGNSSTKFVLWEGCNVVRSMVLENDALEREPVIAFVAGQHLRSVALCSVADFPLQLLDGLGSLLCFTPTVPTPLSVDYTTPSTLGADRLAAAVGAWTLHPGKEILVIDIGTAATFDHVTAGGVFAGGSISPGLGMRLQALHDMTGRLPRIDTPRILPTQRDDFAHDTASAILCGCVNGLAAEAAHYHSRLSAACGEPPQVVATGRTSLTLMPYFTFPAAFDEHLVGRGLNSILAYNEK